MLAFAFLPDYTLGMMENGKISFIGKKAYEIAYALWRIAANSSEKAFADILRNKAIELIGFAADANYVGLDTVGDSLHAVVKFAVDVNCITIGNAAILSREIGNLKSAISNIAAISNNIADINIADIFSSQDELVGKLAKNYSHMEPEDFAGMDLGNEPGNQDISKKAEIRQAAILQKMQEIGNCRLADIQAILPNTSERTLRYDVESLVQRNLIERVGTGGRSVYYRVKGVQ